MLIKYSLTNSDVLEMTPHLPEYFEDKPIKGADSFHFINNSVCIIYQEVSTKKASFCIRGMYWYKPQRIWCHYDYPDGLFTRIGLDHDLIEKINGIGNFEVIKNQYVSLAGNEWLGSFFPSHAGTYHFIDLWFSAEFLGGLLYDHPRLRQIIENTIKGYPDKIVGPVLMLTPEMKEVIEWLSNSDHTTVDVKKNFHIKMKKLARLILNELFELKETKKNIPDETWDKYKQGLALVDADPRQHITAKALGKKVGLNEYQMKKGIKLLTGTGLDEYRVSAAIKMTGKEMLKSNAPVKYYSDQNDYDNPSNFNRPFKAIYGCTPRQLRTQKTGTKIKPKYKIKEEDKFVYGTLIARFMGDRLTLKQRIKLDEWLLADEAHLQLFEDLTDEDRSEFAQQFFNEAEVDFRFVKWKKEGGWQETDTYQRDKRRFIIGIIICILVLIFYILDTKYRFVKWVP
ncbi:MAG: helix-turn-helix transcriptional regulator [Chitinophagaceae bacterium]|nr:helix-turn-helix transcriptional regulator [Chitinophagaceae bacterium]